MKKKAAIFPIKRDPWKQFQNCMCIVNVLETRKRCQYKINKWCNLTRHALVSNYMAMKHNRFMHAAKIEIYTRYTRAWPMVNFNIVESAHLIFLSTISLSHRAHSLCPVLFPFLATIKYCAISWIYIMNILLMHLLRTLALALLDCSNKRCPLALIGMAMRCIQCATESTNYT